MNKKWPQQDKSGGWRAPGKLNLFLHIVGQRADGYHLLQSIFQLIDYHDVLYLNVRADGKIHHHNPLPGVPAEQDLTVRAAKALQKISLTPLGVDIQIEKRLPMGGGFGGGSSNAATMLLALNQLWQLDYSRETLQKIGLTLGADVPFFIFGQNAWVEGIGEVLQPISLPEQYFVILKPPVSVSTADIYRAPDLTRNTKSIRMRDFEMAQTKNDFEPIVSKQYPEIAAAIQWLNQFSPARMTGSGSGIFACFATQNEANAVISQAPECMTGFVTRSIKQHPLYEFAH
jgi:4-diphosphocytidyl-2-C-methyl-D-erythritol kinase